jgi:hypothetical protein
MPLVNIIVVHTLLHIRSVTNITNTIYVIVMLFIIYQSWCWLLSTSFRYASFQGKLKDVLRRKYKAIRLNL